MKTPMQEMFDQLKASKKDEYGLAFSIDMLLENEQEMLEKEKEVMCEFAKCCTSNGSMHEIDYVFNETFKSEEK